jgi:glycerol-3-phosphate acyltransferase PlsY
VLVFLLILTALQAYVIGSVNGAIIVSKYFYKKDIREYGSGNAGLTNFYRVFGKGGAVLVVLIDVLKTIAPVIIGGLLFSHFVDAAFFKGGNVGLFRLSFFGSEYAGFFVMLGHCYPLFYGFRGGKGVMAMGTILFFVDWRVALAGWGTFILLTLLTRFVSLGSIIGCAAYPVAQALLGLGGPWELVVAAASAVLLISRHWENIKRLVKGKESKFSFRRKKA